MMSLSDQATTDVYVNQTGNQMISDIVVSYFYLFSVLQVVTNLYYRESQALVDYRSPSLVNVSNLTQFRG